MALRHCVPRRRPSASNPLSPRSKANIIPSYMLAASLSSPVLPVGSVVLPHASWPGEHLSIIHSFNQSFFPSSFPFHPTPTSFSSYTPFPGSRLLFSNVPGRGRHRSMHVMRCAPRDHMGYRLLSASASFSYPHCHGFPHPSAPFLTPVLSGTVLR